MERRSARRSPAALRPLRADEDSSCWWAKTRDSRGGSALTGSHLPERAIRRAGAVRWQRDWLITAAAHSPAALRAAASAGADAALLSPVFATASHPDVRALGPRRFAALAHASPLPVYALGGIDSTRARLLQGSGAVGIAGIGGLIPQAPRRYVKWLSILTPDRRAKLTPLSGTAEVVPVANRGDPRGFV